jgi:hypothetical protein
MANILIIYSENPAFNPVEIEFTPTTQRRREKISTSTLSVIFTKNPYLVHIDNLELHKKYDDYAIYDFSRSTNYPIGFCSREAMLLIHEALVSITELS